MLPQADRLSGAHGKSHRVSQWAARDSMGLPIRAPSAYMSAPQSNVAVESVTEVTFLVHTTREVVPSPLGHGSSRCARGRRGTCR